MRKHSEMLPKITSSRNNVFKDLIVKTDRPNLQFTNQENSFYFGTSHEDLHGHETERKV